MTLPDKETVDIETAIPGPDLVTQDTVKEREACMNSGSKSILGNPSRARAGRNHWPRPACQMAGRPVLGGPSVPSSPSKSLSALERLTEESRGVGYEPEARAGRTPQSALRRSDDQK